MSEVNTRFSGATSLLGAVFVRVFITSTATMGRAVAMTALAMRHLLVDSVRGRLPGRECIEQTWLLFTVTAFPAALMAIPFGAVVSVQASGILHDVGATSLTGAAAGMGIVRQGAPMAASLLMGGAASAAIASDLGTRAIREEIDAMRVMGVDPIRRLVVPRLVAMLLISPMILATIIVIGVGSAFVISVQVSDVSPGSFWSSFGSFATMADLCFALVKTLIGGAIVAIIGCLRGLQAQGGPRGVADAVNASVVLSIVMIVFVALALTQLQTMFFPGQFA